MLNLANRNLIESIEEKSFVWMSQLSELYLQGNRMHSAELNVFYGLNKFIHSKFIK